MDGYISVILIWIWTTMSAMCSQLFRKALLESSDAVVLISLSYANKS